MTKTRSFSIFLLKQGYDSSNSLKENTSLEQDKEANALPAEAEIFIMDAVPKQAWWRDFFEIRKSLNQVQKGAVLFLPIEKRVFALTFGHVVHHIKDTAYEYDFGIKVTLNCLDPEKIKNTDTVEPSSSTRQRTQVPIDTSLTFFDFDRDSTILRSLTGKVREEYKEIIRSATGSSSLRVGSHITAEELPDFCQKLLVIYNSEDYKKHFPDIRKISPVKDPDVISSLDEKLLQSVRILSPDATLIIPDIVDYRDSILIGFRGVRGKYISDDIQLTEYGNYLAARDQEIGKVTLEDLKKHEIFLCNEEGQAKGPSFSIYKSLVFEIRLEGDTGIYHFSEGDWYRVEGDYVAKLNGYLNPLYVESPLPPFSQDKEEDYSAVVEAANIGFHNLDQKNIAPPGQRQIEPCDLIRIYGNTVELVHVKISTQSSQLSHLFNQGFNSVDALRGNEFCVRKLKKLIAEKNGGILPELWNELIDNEKYSVIYAIVTHKNAANMADNIPLFSRISLYRVMKNLRARGIVRGFTFVEDLTHSAGLKAV